MTGTDRPPGSPQDPTRERSDASTEPTLGGDPTLAGASVAPRVDPQGDELELEESGRRYEDLSLLGRGGMGEVSLCLDRRIGRQVAMKVIRSGRGSRSDARIRFLREARVQAQLEHPAIVPVYDLGRSDDGQTYFTMKRIRGQALDRILEAMRRDHDVEGITTRRLLGAFSQACLAIDFAHERGVLHRDLKPANIMLGDYGEVYVLDWGLAKIEDAPELERTEQRLVAGDETADGEVLGTPGYIAPEQLDGKAERRSDIYALGAILFEILTLQRLHQGKTPQALLVSALEGADARPTARVPDQEVAPELEQICVRASALDPEDRFPTARALYEALERYLDGDRDLELRRRRAVEHAEAAKAARDRVLEGDEGSRALAMQEVGRTLGLDPGNRDAVSVLATLLQTPPAELPPQAAEELEAMYVEQQRHAARNGGFGYLSGLLYLPLIALLGVVDWVPLIVFASLLVLAGGTSLMAARYADRKKYAYFDVLAMSVGTVAMTSLYPLYGPYLLLPTILHGQVVAASLADQAWYRWASLVISCLGLLVAVALDLTGVIGPVTTFETNRLVIHSFVAEFPPVLTPVVLVVSSLGVIITSSVLLGRARDLWGSAEKKSQLQAWHLRQMIS